MNGNNIYFDMVVCSSSKREIVKTRKDLPIKKALEPILKKWGYRDASKVTALLRYYEFALKPQTQAGDTAGMEVFIKAEDSVDTLLGGFHPFINKTELKSFTQDYINSDGWFLTRESSSGDGQLSLAVTFSKQLRHFKISFNSSEGYKIACKGFEDLHKLIHYYKDHPLKRTPDGDLFLLYPIPNSTKADGGTQPHNSSIQTHNPSIQPHNPSIQTHTPSIQTHTPSVQTHTPSVKQHNGTQQHTSSRPLPPVPGPVVPKEPPPKPTKNNNLMNKVSNGKSKTLPRKLSREQPTTSPIIDYTNRALPPLPPVEAPPLSPGWGVPTAGVANSRVKQGQSNGLESGLSGLGLGNFQRMPPSGTATTDIFTKSNTEPDLRLKPTIPGKGHINGLKGNGRKHSASLLPEKPPSNVNESRLALNARLSPKPILQTPVNEEPAPKLPMRHAEKQLSNPSIASLPDNFSNHTSEQLQVRQQQQKQQQQQQQQQKQQQPQPHATLVELSSAPAQTQPTETESSIPEPWMQVFSKSKNRYYYFNPETNENSWKFPKSSHTVEKKPSFSISSNNDIPKDLPMRQRSQSSTASMNRTRLDLSRDKQAELTFGAVTENSTVMQHNRPAPSPPRQASPVLQPHAQPPVSTKPKREDSQYDYLSNIPSNPPKSPTSKHPTSSFSKPAAVPNHKNTQLNQTKNSDPIRPSPPLVYNHSQPTGKPVKVGKYTIPAPPPNIPPTFSKPKESAPPVVSNKNHTVNKGATLSNNASSVFSSIRDYKPGQLRPVTPDHSPSPTLQSSDDSLMGMLMKRVAQRSKAIQDSDSDYEDSDLDPGWD